MTPKFLREEAARFRGMAGTADLEASKTRLFAMATDFELRATAADELITPKLDEGIKDRAAKKITKDRNNSADQVPTAGSSYCSASWRRDRCARMLASRCAERRGVPNLLPFVLCNGMPACGQSAPDQMAQAGWRHC